MSIYLLITLITIFAMIGEMCFSLYKKDNVYSKHETLGNLLRGIVITIITNKTTPFYFLLSITIFVWLDHTKYSFNPLSFLLCIVTLDFFYYLLHFIKHKVGILWSLHSVHHSDSHFNMSTYYRASWLEHLFVTNIPLILAALLGFDLQTIFIASYCSFVWQFYCHSQYIKLPRMFNLLFITPHLHRVHHDQEIKHQNSNFGAMFSIWDRMFGTYVSEVSEFKPGIKGYYQDNFIKMETDPVIEYIKNVIYRKL